MCVSVFSFWYIVDLSRIPFNQTVCVHLYWLCSVHLPHFLQPHTVLFTPPSAARQLPPPIPPFIIFTAMRSAVLRILSTATAPTHDTVYSSSVPSSSSSSSSAPCVSNVALSPFWASTVYNIGCLGFDS